MVLVERIFQKQCMNDADSQAALMELLEIPQLMETCMRNGNHDDALALRSLLAKLAFLHSDVQVSLSIRSTCSVNDLSHYLLCKFYLP